MRFLVMGEALIDLVQSPADGRFVAHPGGSPFNVAITLGRLGHDVDCAAQAGRDPFGILLTDHLRESNVSLERWRQLPEPTSLAVAALDADGNAEYHFYFDGTAGLACDVVPELSGIDVLHAGSIASWLAPAASVTLDALRSARSNGRTLVSYDPNVRPALITNVPEARTQIEEYIAAAHVVKASAEDLAFLYGDSALSRDAARSGDSALSGDAALKDVAARWCELGATLVVITRGADGAVAFGPTGLLAACPAPRIVVADTVGAGDSFTGGLLSMLATSSLAEPHALLAAVENGDKRIDRALRRAVAISALTCERPGANPPTAAELSERLERDQ